jgi:hypothetical protein
VRACFTSCGQYSVSHTARSCVQTAMALSHVPELRRLRLHMTSNAASNFNMEASVIKGMCQCHNKPTLLACWRSAGLAGLSLVCSAEYLTSHGIQHAQVCNPLRTCSIDITMEDASAGQLQSVLEVSM